MNIRDYEHSYNVEIRLIWDLEYAYNCASNLKLIPTDPLE